MESGDKDPYVWDYLLPFFFRPFIAFLFVLLILSFGWWVAWKTVLVHVPLVQEIFGLRQKNSQKQRPLRRYTQYYNSLYAARNKASSSS